MAFSNYSNLFKCGLLSEGTSPSYATAPWATEYCGPRRGSLPSIDAFSDYSDFSAHPLPPPTSSGTSGSTASASNDGSFYFTFKKKRNPAEHRSFLSLDLAESQSLRSVSTKGKDKATGTSNRRQQTESSFFSPTFSHSFVPMLSPPALVSPPGSPKSARSIPDPSLPIASKSSVSGPGRPPSIIFAPSPRHGSYAFPTSPTSSIHTQIQRELSPMRFADPSPPPFNTDTSEIDVISERSLRSAEVLSRSSTVSSGYRKAQRWDALKRLEGRGADGAVGRLKPRLSQNFMHLSDDEDEDEIASPAPGAHSMNVIVEDVAAEKEVQSRQLSKTDWTRSHGLSVSVDGQPWYNLTPRQSAWGVLFGGEADGDIDVEVDKIFGLDRFPQPQPDSPQSDDGAPRRPKRSKRSYSPRSPRQTDQRGADISLAPVPFPSKHASTAARSPAHLHPLDASTSASTSSTSSSTRSGPHSQAQDPSRSSILPQPSLGPPASNSNWETYVRLRTVSDFGSSNPHTLVQHESRSHHHGHHHHHKKSRAGLHRQKKPARLELRLDLVPIDGPSFIDMRDENLETDSRSDSWRSLFEVSCAA
ncbi:hypothetical protein ACEPAG_4361 [Sanghuangporus baumii]